MGLLKSSPMRLDGEAVYKRIMQYWHTYTPYGNSEILHKFSEANSAQNVFLLSQNYLARHVHSHETLTALRMRSRKES